MTIVIASGVTDTTSPMVMYQNHFATGTLTASTAAADGAVANLADELTWDFWTPTAVPAWAAVNMGVSTTANCLGIAGHTLGTDGATVALEYWNGAAWVAQSGVTASPVTDEPILILFPDRAATQFRITVTGAVASIAVAFIGQRLIFPTGILSGYTATNHSVRYTLLNNQSVSGQFLGNRVVRRGIEATITFGVLETSWVDGAMVTFEDHYNTGKTFFYAGSPVNLPKDMCYCWRPESGGELMPAYIDDGYWSEMTMDINAYAG